MKKHITKLSSERLLEVSGGFEEDTRNPWAKELGPINPENGKQESKKKQKQDKSAETEVTSEPEVK